MLKNEKGVSIILLIIILAIIIVAIIFGAKYIKDFIEKEKIDDVSTYMLKIQSKVKKVSQDNILKKGELIGETLTDEKQKWIELGLIEEKDDCKKWNKEILEGFDLKDNELNNNTYIINYTKEEVIIEEGYKTKDGKVLYTLTQINEYIKNGEK